MVCLNSGASHMELLEGLEDIYLALSRLETRFNIHIIQIYSDSGTQLAAAILGEKHSKQHPVPGTGGEHQAPCPCGLHHALED